MVLQPDARPVVLAAPTGAGKTTIARRLVEGAGPFVFSVSATTRAPRPGERDGEDYLFVDEERFRGMVEQGELAEWARVHGRLYGTPIRNLDDAAAGGRYPLLDIDVQGARQIRDRVPNALLVFVLPPSVDVWLDRLHGRGTEGVEERYRRLRSAAKELADVKGFDVVLVNDDLEAAVQEVRRVILDGAPGLDDDDVRERVAALQDGVARTLEELRIQLPEKGAVGNR